MLEHPSLRRAVEHARKRLDEIDFDRVLGDGRLGDEELTALLVVPYPTLAGQKN